MPDFEEGDRVQITVEGTVLWLGEKKFEVDEWAFHLADLRYPNFSVRKIE